MVSSFRGASAEAVAALTDQVGSSATVAAELFSVAGTLRAEGALRRFATDGSVASEAKAGLMTQLYDGKVDAATLGLLTDAVGRRWTRSRDLPDAVEYVGVVAMVRSAGNDSDRLVDELFAVRTMFGDNSDLRVALADPARSRADKEALVDTLLDGKVLPATVALVKQALSGSHRTVAVALEEYEKVATDVHGRGVATVRVARPLTEGDEQRLGAAPPAQYGRPVHLNVVVDPDVIGGIKVEIGDDVIDGTVASRLDDARRKIAG
jgi:F-type H+-transporting ATPase subunit delta